MESILATEIVKALGSGDITKFISYVLIFFFIWIEVRGMKTELKNLNLTVAKSFAEGEKRMEAIEENQKQYEHRLTLLEKTRGNS